MANQPSYSWTRQGQCSGLCCLVTGFRLWPSLFPAVHSGSKTGGNEIQMGPTVTLPPALLLSTPSLPEPRMAPGPAPLGRPSLPAGSPAAGGGGQQGAGSRQGQVSTLAPPLHVPWMSPAPSGVLRPMAHSETSRPPHAWGLPIRIQPLLPLKNVTRRTNAGKHIRASFQSTVVALKLLPSTALPFFAEISPDSF